jgi:hypothetical protein
MVDIPILMINAACLLGIFNTELYDGYQKDDDGNFVDENGNPVSMINNPFYILYLSMVTTIIDVLNNLRG